jgi:energy-coupling factor transport system ATP-binding protein
VADAISLEGVGFAYAGRAPVLHDISLTIREGEVVALVGPTGSGKSTLLHICAGVIPHYIGGELTGRASVLGMDTRASSLAKLVTEMAVVTQDPENQLFNLFVADEVVWGMENRGLDRERIAQRLDHALGFFAIRHLRDRITYDLSGGEKQRVVLAANYAPAPRLFILDSPTSQLDPIGSEQVLQGIRELAQAGHAIFLVEEKLDDLWSLVDRVVLLDQGTIQLDIARRDLDRYIDRFAEAQVVLPQLVELGARLRQLGAPIPPLPPEPERAAEVLAPLVGARSASAGDERRSVPQLRGGEGHAAWRAAERGSAAERGGVPWRAAEGDRRGLSEGLGTDGSHRLRVTDLSFTYPPPRRTAALTHVDLALPAGAVVALVGQNGSGKTTLARCVSGLLKPTSGRVQVDGRDIHRLSVRERARHVGYVFQNPDQQIFKDPVLDDVLFGPLNLGVSRPEALEISEHVLRALGLWDKRDIHPFRLSKGDRQRLAIASIAAMRPSVIVIDEPTTGQDMQQSHAIMALLAQMAREFDQTVVAITHAMHLVAAHCDLMIALCEGEIIAQGPPQQVFRQEETLRRTFVKPPAVTALGNRLGLDPPPLSLELAVDLLAPALLEAART